MSDEDLKLLDRKAISLIRPTLAKNVAFNISNCTTTIEVLETLTNMYQKPTATNKVFLMRNLFNLKMSEGANVVDHVNQINVLLTQLSSVEINFDDELRALILLSSLPESWEQVATSVSSSIGHGKLKWDDIRDLIISEEIRRKCKTQSSSSALNLESRGRSQNRGKFRSNSKSRGKSKGKKNVICWNCDKPCHFRSECRAPKKQSKGKESESSANYSEGSDDALVCCVVSSVDSWVLDSGASFHSTHKKENLKNYRDTEISKVYLADGKALEVCGRGEAHIQTKQGLWILKNVRFVPKLSKQLISVSQLDDEGIQASFGSGSWKITKGVRIVARGQKNGTLYLTDESNLFATISTAENSTLWHNRMGHISEKGLKVLVKNDKFPKMNWDEMETCEDCILGKQRRVSFSKSPPQIKQAKLELVHSDVWGPAPVDSISGSKYYVTFIDDSTRKVWVYFLKNKSDVFSIFKKWKAEVETRTGCKLKCLKSDNGGEYDSTEFKKFCEEHGIRREWTVAANPQQNGVAERMNRTLNERARSMRLHSGLPKCF